LPLDGLFSNKTSQFGPILEGLAMENLGIFYDHLVYFTAIGKILWPFGIFCGHSVYLSPFWYFVPRKIWQPWSERGAGINFFRTGLCSQNRPTHTLSHLLDEHFSIGKLMRKTHYTKYFLLFVRNQAIYIYANLGLQKGAYMYKCIGIN
jgi:hypothetical protein